MPCAQNTSSLFGRIISAKLATLHELQTIYTLEDAYRLDEILLVDNYNTWLVNRQQSK